VVVIRNIRHAQQVQARRRDKGLPGIAAAVRRYIRRVNKRANYSDALAAPTQRVFEALS
jgi:hypothetical protein